MKSLKYIFSLFVFGLLYCSSSFAYNVTLHYNGITEVIPVDGQEEINLQGNWSENNDYYTFNGAFDYLDIYYNDQYGRQKTERTINDVYLNGEYTKSYTGAQYTELTSSLVCDNTGNIIIFTGGDLPIRIDSSTGNVFSNFGDNALALIYGNIPGIITAGFILFMILFLVRLFIPKNRR